MDNLIKNLLISPNIIKYKENVKNKISQTIFGLKYSEYALLLDNKSIVITNSIDEGLKLQKQLDSINKKTFFIKSSNLSYLYSEVGTQEQEIELIKGVNLYLKNEIDILIVNCEVLLQKFKLKEDYLQNILNLEINKSYDIDLICKTLIQNGYKKSEIVEDYCFFSSRGDTITFYPIESEYPVRLEFFDDILESISYINLDTLKVVEKIKEYKIFPCILNVNNNEENLKENIKKFLSNFKPKNLDIEIKVNENLGKCVSKSIFDLPLNYIIPFLDNYNITFFELFENENIFFGEPKLIIDKLNVSYKNIYNELISNINIGNLTSQHLKTFFDPSEIFKFKNNSLTAFSNILNDNRIFKSKDVLNFKASGVLNYNNLQTMLINDLKNNILSNITTILFCKNENNYISLLKTLKNEGLQVILKEDLLSTDVINGKIILCKESLDTSVYFVDEKLCLISEYDLFKITKTLTKTSTNKNITFLPKVGDYVVHQTHGIGKCIGIESLKLSDVKKDYILIEYSGGDIFYLPCEQISSLTSFMVDNEKPKLNKLGSTEFYKSKQKVLSSLEDIADDLIKIYGARFNAKGYKYPEDDLLQSEFEKAFPYVATEDQIQAINDIKKDMESGKIMDRLVCGDVGYGKTEVALRAAYKTILSGKQVAFLSPTTILSFQHYNTCLNRMKDFMVNVDLVNRFKSASEIKESIKKLSTGETDLLCGTHRLLSEDIVFKDLGLLILDEEQRFGVKDKEKIKKLKSNVNVITLSATPIPRTLHMSLVGIRDISIIETPPKDRLPVQTTVCEFNYETLKFACDREISRNGQVLIIYNRVETIYKFMESVKKIMPEYRVSCIHGQMQQNILEKEMISLYNKEIDIMISTTLIENGIDLPTANTLFIVNADQLGLSQLYQLKGRVGRSTRLGYAFFTYDKDKILSEQAFKRLEAISSFTELGSGLKIAYRDLEIRGTGNVLGKQQHGHMQKVGYDLYCKLLKQAVNKKKGAEVVIKNEVKLDIMIDAYIPQYYIDDSETRIKCYAKLSSINSEKTRSNTLKEIEEVFGELPKEIINLSYVSYLKSLTENNQIKRVFINKNSFYIELYKDENIVNQKVFVKASKLKDVCKIDFTSGLKIYFNVNYDNVLNKMQFLIDFLN